MWRAAVLAAIRRQSPGNDKAWELAHQHFGCAREAAASLQSHAQVCTLYSQSHATMRGPLAISAQWRDLLARLCLGHCSDGRKVVIVLLPVLPSVVGCSLSFNAYHPDEL